MILSSPILISIAKDLSTFKEAKRAKKLVFYASQKYWERDFKIIESYAWEDLLTSLYESNPTKDDLKAILHHAVNTLNRKDIYLKIAKYIFQKMSSLYNYSSHAWPRQNNEDNKFDQELIKTIIHNIEQNEESPRMKKLIFAACHKYWENDISVINAYDMDQIIIKLRRQYPTIKALRNVLTKIIGSINRQNFYSFIADTILGELTYLYTYEPTLNLNTNNLVSDDEDETKLILGNKGKSSSQKSSNQIETQASKTIIVEDLDVDQEDKSQNITNTVEINIPEEQIIPWEKINNLFNLKQEIMQYTNPLRAKILLFYAIYQINPLEQHWSIVRTCTLDDLLLRLFQYHQKNLQEIESNLTTVANSSLDSLNTEDNLQTVSAIVEAIKRFHKKDQ